MHRVSFGFFGIGLITTLLLVGTVMLHSARGASDPYFTTLYDFSEAASPSALVLGRDGDFYGTTEYGGASSQGSIYKITPSGTLTTLVSFDDTNGGQPSAALVLGNDGNLYGTTRNVGSTPATVFKITPVGTLTTLASFNGGSGTTSALVQGNDGDFYGTTTNGGTYGVGMVYKITPGGTLATLYNFNASFYINGENPTGLVLGGDGNFYGTTTNGGTYGNGTVFKITPSGVLTTLYTFNDTDGFAPYPLILGGDGNFYGTNGNGGTYNAGYVFKITPPGAFTTLYSFNVGTSNGSSPSCPLFLARDGNFYGTTFFGGSHYGGTFFRITPAGQETDMYDFSFPGPSSPVTSVLQGSDGSFYGTTPEDIYRINPAAILVASFAPASGPVGSMVYVTGKNLTTATSVRFHDASAHIFSASADGTQLAVTVPQGAMKGTITVMSANSSVTTTAPFRTTYVPVINSFSPTSGPVSTVVTITGTHLDGITRVRFHEADATVYSSNAAGTQLLATVPPGAATGTITLDNRDVLATTSTQVFTVTP